MTPPKLISLLALSAFSVQPLFAFQNGHFLSTPALCPDNKVPPPSISLPKPSTTTTTSLCYSNWDTFGTPDSMELLIGGTRYEMVELPDAMMSTTLFVGNLCEFVTDEMLSELFQQASTLKFVPACVARKPNMESLKYGFVTFRSEEEKEIARDLLQGYEVNGKCLKVEAIKDNEKTDCRIKVPGKIIEYALGPAKRTRTGEINTLRRATTGATVGMSSESSKDASYYKDEREMRRARLEKRKTRGRYKNQQRKNSRAVRVVP